MVTTPLDPVGPPSFQRFPFVHDVVLDPDGAKSSRLAMTHMLSSLMGINSTSATLHLSRLTFHTLYGPCLRFGPHVTVTPARLGSNLPATALVGRDFHPQATASFAWRTPICAEDLQGKFFVSLFSLVALSAHSYIIFV